MNNGVCFENFSDITDDLINHSLQTITCCMKAIYHILFFSNLSFRNLHTLRQSHECGCTTNMYVVFVHLPHRLSKLQKLYYFDGIPATIRTDQEPFEGLPVFYLLARNIDEMKTKLCLFMCLRYITYFDKGLVKHICSYIKQDDLVYLHIKSMEQTVMIK